MLRARAGSFEISIPQTRSERMEGLRGHTLDPGEALLLERCRSIQTFGMRQPILVAWLDSDYRVIDVQHLRPRRLATNLRARHVLECRPDEDVQVGDLMKPTLVRS